MNDFKRILIIRLDRIGDVLLSTPVFRSLREAFPKSHIAVMVRPYTRDIVGGNPYINEVILYDKDKTDKDWVSTLRFITGIRKKRFDLAIVLHPSNRSNVIPFLAGIPVRVGYNKKLGFLLTKGIPHKKQLGLKHELDYTLDVVRYIGIKPASRELYMPVSSESEARVRRLFEESGIDEGSVVVTIHPVASCPSRIWPAERFAEVADTLAEKYAAEVVLISGPHEKGLGDGVARLTRRRCLNLSGKTSVADMASVLRRSRLLISSDSGPMHISCAVATPVVVIFGRSGRGLGPKRWGPTDSGSIVLHKDIGCEVCLAHNCVKGFSCLKAVSVDDVLGACGKILQNH